MRICEAQETMPKLGREKIWQLILMLLPTRLKSFNFLQFHSDFVVLFAPRIPDEFLSSSLQGSARGGSGNWIHLLDRSRWGNRIHLPLGLYKLCALCICMSVLSYHPKTNYLPIICKFPAQDPVSSKKSCPLTYSCLSRS